jgi:hypothetical protein
MMLAEANFTPIVVRVPMDHMQALWLRFGTVRYGFLVSLFFNALRGRFVPVRFSRHRYGTVHPSIGGCTRTTPVQRTRTGLPGQGSGRRPRTGPRLVLVAPATRSVPSR